MINSGAPCVYMLHEGRRQGKEGVKGRNGRKKNGERRGRKGKEGEKEGGEKRGEREGGKVEKQRGKEENGK